MEHSEIELDKHKTNGSWGEWRSEGDGRWPLQMWCGLCSTRKCVWAEWEVVVFGFSSTKKYIKGHAVEIMTERYCIGKDFFAAPGYRRTRKIMTSPPTYTCTVNCVGHLDLAVDYDLSMYRCTANCILAFFSSYRHPNKKPAPPLPSQIKQLKTDKFFPIIVCSSRGSTGSNIEVGHSSAENP